MCEVKKQTKRGIRRDDPVMPVLKTMEIEETHSWDKKRMATIATTKRIVEVQTGKKFITRTSDEKMYVTRVR